MGLRDFFLPPRRPRLDEYDIDWSSPELQPIAGVSLQTYVAATQQGGGPVAMAERAAVSAQAWTEASVGWQVRQSSSQMVRVAATKIVDPNAGFRRTFGV